MPDLLIFLRCSLAFVILPVSVLLVFMPLFSEPSFSLVAPHQQKTPPGLLPTHSLLGSNLPTSYHRSFNNFFIAIFSDLLFILCFVLF